MFGSFVCTCTLTIVKSPIQITQSPICKCFSLNLSISLSVVFGFIWITLNSVQYANWISSINSKLAWNASLASTVTLSSNAYSKVTSSDNAFQHPVKNTIKPRPPASITPAFFKTGNISGVCCKTSSPSFKINSKNSSKSLTFFETVCALSANALIIVSIVPSCGFVTALYATSHPSFNALAKTLVVTFSFCSTTVDIPFKTCDKITPLLPLAPFNAPLAIAWLTSSILFVAQLLTSAAVDFNVKNIFVPVSASITG